jgi:cation:H+ antiporter
LFAQTNRLRNNSKIFGKLSYGIILIMILIWMAVFIISLAALVKGADWLIDGAERVGLALGLSPFIVGVTIVGIGTSLPELISSVVATIRGLDTVATANAIGSNITNIFLVVGIATLLSRRIAVKKDLIDLDLPLFASITALFLLMAADTRILLFESLLLLIGYGIYLVYTVRNRELADMKGIIKTLPADAVPRGWRKLLHRPQSYKRPHISSRDIGLLLAGSVLLAGGAYFVIDSLEQLAGILNVGAGVITILAVAFGTSLPEVTVTLNAARRGKPEVALGNIIGSCVFNLLMVVGVAGLFSGLVLDFQSYNIGLPFLAVSSLLFVISGISRRIYAWEGSVFILLYVLFISEILSSL